MRSISSQVFFLLLNVLAIFFKVLNMGYSEESHRLLLIILQAGRGQKMNKKLIKHLFVFFVSSLSKQSGIFFFLIVPIWYIFFMPISIKLSNIYFSFIKTVKNKGSMRADRACPSLTHYCFCFFFLRKI